MVTLRSIHADEFARFGKVLEFTDASKGEQFEIVITEEKEPWRLAVYRYADKSIKRMECHPSLESFEPLYGLTVLVVAEHDRPADYEAFILDKPVCLYKGIWHQVLSLTDEAAVKIAENLVVTSEFYYFDKELEVSVG